MNVLARRIARMIEMDGPISVGTFMMLALHDREMGFYATRESIGAEGAFVTAPEISQAFGEILALWCVRCWRDQGCPANPLLIEFGPGRGTLMSDMLRVFRGIPDFLEELDVFLVEASAKLESAQRALLADARFPVHWVHGWSEIATNRPRFVIANEFFDALPIRQFVMTERGWCERMVTSRRDALMFALSPHPIPLPNDTARGDAALGAVYEICPGAVSLTEDLARTVAASGGSALIIDYGHGGQGYGDTLQGARNHAYDDLLAAPGETDLSAHVDFSALARVVRRGGARVHGPVGQGDFLRRLGIEMRRDHLARANPAHSLEIETAVSRLIDAEKMGHLFKVLSIAPPDVPAPPGFC